MHSDADTFPTTSIHLFHAGWTFFIFECFVVSYCEDKVDENILFFSPEENLVLGWIVVVDWMTNCEWWLIIWRNLREENFFFFLVNRSHWSKGIGKYFEMRADNNKKIIISDAEWLSEYFLYFCGFFTQNDKTSFWENNSMKKEGSASRVINEKTVILKKKYMVFLKPQFQIIFTLTDIFQLFFLQKLSDVAAEKKRKKVYTRRQRSIKSQRESTIFHPLVYVWAFPRVCVLEAHNAFRRVVYTTVVYISS